MMPMVFSATVLSMPAFAASRPINSSIVPRPHPVTCRILAYRIYLDLVRSELQATSACEGAIQLRSHDECCSNARVGARCAAKLPRAGTRCNFRCKQVPRPVDPLVAGWRSPWGGVDRVQQACKMQYDAGARRADTPAARNEAIHGDVR